MKTGIASVTFRELPYMEVIRLVKEAGLDGIEWGGDMHCLPGDIKTAREILKATQDAGLTVISYGSYYHVGCFENFDGILETALTLETKNIRVWAGGWLPSINATEQNWNDAIADSQRIADMAMPYGIDISYEYHDNSLTDSLDSALRLLNAVQRDNVLTYWQAPAEMPVEENLEVLRTLVSMKKLKNAHVFSTNMGERLPLEANADDWRRYIHEMLPANPALLLEFVKDDSPANFLQDGAFLKTLV